MAVVGKNVITGSPTDLFESDIRRSLSFEFFVIRKLNHCRIEKGHKTNNLWKWEVISNHLNANF